MKLHEILSLEWVGNNKLFEMSVPRKKAHRFISALGSPIVEQFLKLTYLNSPNDHNHWLQDGLNNYLSQIQKITLKPDDTRPSPETYYIWLFDDIYTLNEGNIVSEFRILRQVKYKSLLLKKPFNATEVLNDIQHLFNPGTSKLLLDISLNKFKTIEDYHHFE